MLAKYLKTSGITKKISPHSLRCTFATYKAERGVSPYVLREWLGHARLDTTQIYVHMARENTKKAMEATSLRGATGLTGHLDRSDERVSSWTTSLSSRPPSSPIRSTGSKLRTICLTVTS
jgi:hypothetical protein